MEIADSGVNAPWYLLLAVFWALLWRPRTRAGMAVAAFVAFAAAACRRRSAGTCRWPWSGWSGATGRP
jgi:hypothetical protein